MHRYQHVEEVYAVQYERWAASGREVIWQFCARLAPVAASSAAAAINWRVWRLVK